MSIFVFDTQNPKKNAFEVSQAWVDIMSRKEPGRYQVKTDPKKVVIQKKKVVVVGKKEIAQIKKEDVSLYSHQASAPTQRNQPKPKG